MVEVFVARVFGEGKVTIPLRIRDVLKIEDGDYVRLSVVEVVKKSPKKAEGKRDKASVKAKARFKPA